MHIQEDYFAIARLIANSLVGTLTEEEQQELDAWRGVSEEHERLYQQLTDNENQPMEQARFASFNSEVNWNNLLHKKNQEKRKRLYFRLARYAAVLFIPVCVGLYFLLSDKFGTLPETVITISPGGYKAHLTLSDGKVVDLTTDRGDIHAVSEQAIILNGEQLISYQDTLLEKGEELIYNELYVPVSGEYQLRLSDGTLVFLNSATKIRFPVRFIGDTREVELEGEAYFEVVANEKMPFVVKTSHYNVTVLGTRFNVSAYPDDTRIRTVLVEGAVLVSGGEVEKGVHLKPDELFTLDVVSRQTTVESVRAAHYTMWKSGKFGFLDERLEDMMKMVERWYDLEVVFMDEELKDFRFGLFANRHESIEPLLRIFEQNGKVKIEQDGKTLTIKRMI